MAYEELFAELLRIETENDVSELLRNFGLIEFNDTNWLPFGGVENNYGTIGTQQADAISALVEKIVRFEQKAHRELGARLRQWSEYLKDVDRGTASSTSNYSTAVEARAMIAAIQEQLQLAPFALEGHASQQIALIDNQLRLFWEPGDFVWPDTWRPAYPETEYWWLYGKPRDKRRSS